MPRRRFIFEIHGYPSPINTRRPPTHTFSWSVAKTPQRDALKTLRDIGGVSAMLVRRAQGPLPAVSGSASPSH